MNGTNPPDKPGLQRCHYCFKYKPIDQYRLSTRNGQTLPVNICGCCEGKGYTLDNTVNDPAINTFKENTFLVAFIGKTSYKEICEVYGIRYEETTTDTHS